MSALVDPEIDIIWAFCGGYGADVVAHKSLALKPIGSKILIGFSDITMLHMLFAKFGMPSIHGPMLSNMNDQDYARVIGILSGDDQIFKLKTKNDSAKNLDLARGEILGGNLCVLTTVFGTKLQPNLDNKILLLEDWDEPGYRLMRYFKQLENVENFDKLKAIILGDFLKGDENMKFALEQFCSNVQVPVFSTNDIGHGDVNKPFVIGVDAEIENGNLVIQNIL